MEPNRPIGPATDVQQLNFDGTPLYPEPEMSVEPEKQGLIQRIGDTALRLANLAQVMAADTMDHLKQNWQRIVPRAALAGLALAGAAGFMEHKSVDAGYADYPAHTQAWLYLHPSPTAASTRSELMPPDTRFDIQCFTIGSNEEGDVVWDFGMDARTGRTGYASDRYLSTPDTQGNEIAQLEAAGIPECGTGSTTQQTANSAPTPAPTPEESWDISPTSEHTYVDHVVWADTPYGKSLHVYMTKRGYLESFAVSKSAFREVMRDAHLAYSGSMYNQFACHAEIAPPSPLKRSWNLDTWRPDVGLAQTIKDICNPLPGEKKD